MTYPKGKGARVSKYVVTLEIDTPLNPNKWNWWEILDLNPEEEQLSVWVEKEDKSENV